MLGSKRIPINSISWNSSWELEITLTVSILNTAVWEVLRENMQDSFLTRLEARHEFDKILSSKRKKGYELIFIEEEWDECTLLPLESTLQNKTNILLSFFSYPIGETLRDSAS